MSSSSAKTEPEYWAIQRQRRIVPGRDTVVGRAALEGRVVHVADIRDIRTTRSPMLWRPGHVPTGVPLLRDGEPIGVIGLSRKRVEPFTERQIELVRTLSSRLTLGG